MILRISWYDRTERDRTIVENRARWKHGLDNSPFAISEIVHTACDCEVHGNQNHMFYLEKWISSSRVSSLARLAKTKTKEIFCFSAIANGCKAVLSKQKKRSFFETRSCYVFSYPQRVCNCCSLQKFPDNHLSSRALMGKQVRVRSESVFHKVYTQPRYESTKQQKRPYKVSRDWARITITFTIKLSGYELFVIITIIYYYLLSFIQLD